jgi:TRAP-type C4-dicarboxylate transport system permease small subunit
MNFVARVPAVIAGTALAILVGITVLSVITRYLFDAPLYWLEEVSGLLIIWIIMVGAIPTERDGQHLTIPMLTDLLPRRLGAAVEVAVTTLSIVVLGYVGWLGWRLAVGAREKLTDILEISWFWIDVSVTIGAIGIALYMIGSLRRAVALALGATPTGSDRSSSPTEGHEP